MFQTVKYNPLPQQKGINMRLDPKKIDQHFLNVRRVVDDKCEHYAVRHLVNDIANVTYWGNGEWRIYVDSFPLNKRCYATNIPIRTVQEFTDMMGRLGLVLKVETDEI